MKKEVKVFYSRIFIKFYELKGCYNCSNDFGYF